MSTEAGSGFSNCSCSLLANDTGITMVFDSYPPAINCSSKLGVVFEDKSIQVRCGAPSTPLNSQGTRATIIYTVDDNTSGANSSYCLTFYAGIVEFTLKHVFFCLNKLTEFGKPLSKQSSNVPYTVQVKNNNMLYKFASLFPIYL